MSGWRARVLARRGLRRGHTSREFSLTDLAEAVHSDHHENVYIDVDLFDNLVTRGGPARAVINARLAPAPPLATALLCIDTDPQNQGLTLDLSTYNPYRLGHTLESKLEAERSTCALGSFMLGQSRLRLEDDGSSKYDLGSLNTFAEGSLSKLNPRLETSSERSLSFHEGAMGCKLRLRLEADVAPLQEISVWFDEQTLAQIDMPFLTLRNITGKNNYTCHECGADFEQPNSLKVHLFMGCRSFDPDIFWGTVLRRLRAVAPTPARLEALAAAWGRSSAGHVCMYCGKLYSRKYGLKIHIRTHTGYKPLRCRYCARAFGDPSNLNKHVRLHAAADDGAAYACALCGKRLARRRDLQRHHRSHHAHD